MGSAIEPGPGVVRTPRATDKNNTMPYLRQTVIRVKNHLSNQRLVNGLQRLGSGSFVERAERGDLTRMPSLAAPSARAPGLQGRGSERLPCCDDRLGMTVSAAETIARRSRFSPAKRSIGRTGEFANKEIG